MSRVQETFRLKPLAHCAFVALCVVAAQAAHAQAAQAAISAQTQAPAAVSGDLGSVQSTATGDSTSRRAYRSQTAPANAPTQATLKTTEPQSIISKQYIENNLAPTANYTEIVAVAPSVFSVSPNGSGLMETPILSIRGFQDGQYNVTFDGVPFGDSNDFTHHSTSFFTNQLMGDVDVDRGPGEAKQIGFATFGGTVGLSSKDPSNTPGVTLFGSYGSWDTALAGFEFNSGVLQNWGDGKVMVGGTSTTSDGYLTGASSRRQNLYFKLEKPIGNDTVITVFADYNKLHQNVSYGATAAQIAAYGPNYGLNHNAASQADQAYNFDLINTDFEYLNIRSKQDSWTLNNKIYTYAYYHNGFQGCDPNGEYPNNESCNAGLPVTAAGAVSGEEMNNNYRAWGDVFNADRDLGPGTLSLGAWVAYQTNFRDLFDANPAANWGAIPGGVARNMQDQFLTLEPYAQYEWKLPTLGLSITPGLRWVDFTRHLEADVNQKTGNPADMTEGFRKLLPSITVRDQLAQNLSVYAQFAQGYLASNLNTMYVNSIAAQPKPESTNNYQTGFVYKTDALTFDADLYYIVFQNYVNHNTIGGQTYYYNAGGAAYKGIETEGTLALGYGFNLYGNLALNSAKLKGQAGAGWIQSVPKMTAAAGLLYNRGPLDASAMFKFVGRQLNGYTDINGNNQALGGYGELNLSATYTINNLAPWTHDTKIGLHLDNVLNRTGIIATAGNTVQDGTPLFWTLPGRAIIGTFQTSF